MCSLWRHHPASTSAAVSAGVRTDLLGKLGVFVAGVRGVRQVSVRVNEARNAIVREAYYGTTRGR